MIRAPFVGSHPVEICADDAGTTLWYGIKRKIFDIYFVLV